MTLKGLLVYEYWILLHKVRKPTFTGNGNPDQSFTL